MKILLLDNYDSFTFNLFQLVFEASGTRPDVFRNDKISLEAIEQYDKILLSPGPGLPSEAGIMPELIENYADRKSIFGVCLGHQCIAEVFGAKLENTPRVSHGIGLPTLIVDHGEKLFRDVPRDFVSGRYHSWIVSNEDFPACLKITAIDEQNRIMALQHLQHDVRGVQFHPESILTAEGAKMMKNWLEN